MKKMSKIIALFVAIALVIGAIPVAFTASTIKAEKSYSYPVPLSLIPDSSFPLEILNSVNEPKDFRTDLVRLSDNLLSQRIMLQYGAEPSGIYSGDGYFEEGDHPFDFTASPATLEAYGLTNATLKEYVRKLHYSRPDMIQFSYDGSDWMDYWAFMNQDVEPMKEISIGFADSLDLYPKDHYYMQIGNTKLVARVVGNPTFNFYLENGPSIMNSAYAPADGILYDAAFKEGSTKALNVKFFVTEEDESQDVHDLYAERPETITLRGIDIEYEQEITGYTTTADPSAPPIPLVSATGNSFIAGSNDNIGYSFQGLIETLEAGLYSLEFPFEKGTTRFILKINEAACDRSEENCVSYSFTDLPKKWYHKAIDFMVEQGLMEGTGNNTFRPNALGDRAQFVTMLWRLLGKPAATTQHPFTDVPKGKYYSKAVAWAYENNIVDGTSATTFSPTKTLTREQAAVMFSRFALNYFGDPLTMDYTLLNKYPDNAKVSRWAKDGMLWACNEEVIEGKTNQYDEVILDPQGKITRAEIAQIFYNYLG